MIMIEEMTEEILTKAKNGELRSLRFRAAQIYKRHFHGNQKLESEGWERAFLLEKYYQVIQSLKTRGILTKGIFEIDQVIFKDTIYGLDVPGLADVVLVPDYVSIGGSFVKSPKEAEDIDIIFREDDKGRDESVELKVGRLITERTKKEPHFIYSPYGPHSTYIPVFDLVLRPKHETKRTEVQEGSRKKKNSKVKKTEEQLKDYEYLIHHVESKEDGKEEVHHCYFSDHIANLFEQSHLVVKDGVPYLDGKIIKNGVFHMIKGLEPTQEVVRSDEEAKENGIIPKEMKAGMTLKEKAKEW